MIKEAATDTDTRKRKIVDVMKDFNYNTCDTVKGFGLYVDSKFAEITARILDAPTLKYAKKTVKPVRGVWRGEEFISPKAPAKWGVMCFDNRASPNALGMLCDMVSIFALAYSVQQKKTCK